MQTLISTSSIYSARRLLLAIGGLLFLSLIVWAFPNISRAALQDDESVAPKTQRPNFVPGEILVRFRSDSPALIATPKSGMQASMSVGDNGGQLAMRVERLNSGAEIVAGLRVARVAPSDTKRALESLRKRPDVIYAELNYIRRKNSTPNDPRFSEMWGLKNNQFTGVTGADINAEQAWNTTTGSRDTVVAVIDEGMDVNHQDLQTNIWRNPGEVSGNGIDDDGNGFVDDLNGYDFFHNDSSVYDGPGTNPDDSVIDAHGTHVAGTIGARGNNGIGVVGVNWQVGLMSLKFLGPDGGSSADLLKAYGYAKMMRDRWITSNGTQGANIRITNNSYGGGGYSQAEVDAIEAMGSSGILFVAAAGNEHQDNGIFPSYPANYDSPNAISVASLDQSRTISSFSNRSSRTVQIAAPGRNILSTTPGNTYGFFSGTSMASPHVAGTAALVLAAHPDMSVARLRGAILFGAEPIQTFDGAIVDGRVLNAAGAIQNAAEVDTVSPAALSDLRIGAQDGRSVALNWTATGDDGSAGQASLYELRFVDASTNSRFLLAVMHPEFSGTFQSANATIPFRHAQGAFVIRTMDNAGNSTDTSLNVSVSDPAFADPYIVTAGAAEPLSVGGEPLSISLDDQLRGIPLPFNFPFYEHYYNSVSVSTNGTLYFDSAPTYDGFSLAGALNGRVMVAGMWDDLDLRKCYRPDGDVYRLVPDNDRVIFRWQGVKFASRDCPATAEGTEPVNFEIELRRDGTIRMRYGQNTPLNPIVGIGGGGPEAYVVDSHTSETTPKDLTNAPALSFSLRRLPSVTDLSVSSTASSNVAAAGQDVTYNITATNRGPARSLGVRVVDTMPTDAIFVSCTTSQGSCSAPANGRVQIDLGLLESGGSATVTIVVKSTIPASFFLNQVNIKGPLSDTDLSNNDSSVLVQLINPNSNPQTGIIGIAAGGLQSFAIRSDRYGLAWGWNYFGQLGDGSVSDKSIAVRIKNITAISAIDAGVSHTLALKQDSSVWSWGRNDQGQLGDGTTIDNKQPNKIAGLTNVIKVRAGQSHSLALRADGTVWAWGDNGSGQLGDGTTVNQLAPAQVPGLFGIIAISAGFNHSLAVKSDGTVWAWGGNDSGQLGDSTTTPRARPVQVTGLTNVIAVFANNSSGFYDSNHLTVTFSVALRSDGTVWTWGHNWGGQLGDGTTNNRSTPGQVPGLTGVTDVAAGGFHVLALRNDGSVWAWGTNYNGQLGDSTKTDRSAPVPVVMLANVQAIAAGIQHSLALKQDGHVVGWGSYSNGQLGFGGTVGSNSYPFEVSKQVPDPLPISTVSLPAFNPEGGAFSSPQNVIVTSSTANVRINSFYVGGRHNMVRLSTGAMYGWGANEQAQLGLDPGQSMPDPTKTSFRTALPLTGFDNVAALSLGGIHNLLLKTDGTVWTSGGNSSGELGYQTNSAPRTTFAQVPGVSGVTAVAAGNGRSMALKTDGSVWAWGMGPINSESPSYNIPPVQVNGLTNVVAIACGTVSFAIRSDGSLWAWGHNYQGILGDGTELTRATPVQVTGVSNVKAVASGFSHSVALKSDGTVWVWGNNSKGQLGLGDFARQLSPVQVPGLTGVNAIAAGGDYTMALKSDGTVWAWGENFHGELGDGTGVQKRSPVAVVGLSGVTGIGAGYQHAVAQKPDGTLFTWGMNDYGQVGDGTTDNQNSPVVMGQLTDGVHIHYTTNGADPTEDDPQLNSGASVSLDHSTVLKARAFKDGWTPSAVKTATFTFASQPFQPVALSANQIELKTWTMQGRTYVYVKPQFPNAGYRVINWGQVAGSGNDFTVDASVAAFTGPSIESVVTTAQIYDLGPLVEGAYNFNFKTSGTLAKTLQFTVSSAAPAPNAIDSAREFVKQQYRDFLNREADQAGEDFWTDNITKCNDPARRPADQTVEQCTLRQRETTSGAFFLSPESQYTGYYVYRMYQGALGRQPKLSEFTPDTQFVGSGIVVNGQLSAAKINQNKADFAAQFVDCTDATKYRCAEFKAIYDGLSNQEYVNKLFLNTGANASVEERTMLIYGLDANPATETRASVLQKIVDGIVVISEGNQQFTTSYGHAFYNSELNRAFVQLEYFGYMKRDPDEAGYAFWLAKLNQYGGNFVEAQMVLAFISSPEYRARFGQP